MERKYIQKKQLLIVDDDEANVELLKFILKKEYDISTAFDGREALKKVDEQMPELILLDIILPDMNGYEVCRSLKGNEKTMSIPILMVSALKDNKDHIAAIEAGADDFLSKPVDKGILIAKIKSLIKVKQYYNNVEHPLNANPLVEDIVKKHLEIIILKLIYKKPMCGFELIKEIFVKYNVLLSQGTVYPFLYSLKEKKILKMEYIKGDMRTKIYSPSESGKQIIERKLNEFIKAEEYILNSIKKK